MVWLYITGYLIVGLAAARLFARSDWARQEFDEGEQGFLAAFSLLAAALWPLVVVFAVFKWWLFREREA